MAIVDLENGEPVCPGWKDKINDLMQEVRELKLSARGSGLGDVVEWYGDMSDPLVWDSDGIGVVGSDQEGWALCMGQTLASLTPPLTATAKKIDGSGPLLVIPNIQGKFTVMVNNAETEFASIGLTGGYKEVLLLAGQSGLREHKHPPLTGGAPWLYDNTVNNDYAGPTSGGGYTLMPSTDGVIDVDGDPALDGEQDAADPHDNLPPFFVLAKKIRFK
jgi:hypothetical protein